MNCVCAGLNIEVDRILEIACIITDGYLTKTVEVLNSLLQFSCYFFFLCFVVVSMQHYILSEFLHSLPNEMTFVFSTFLSSSSLLICKEKLAYSID